MSLKSIAHTMARLTLRPWFATGHGRKSRSQQLYPPASWGQMHLWWNSGSTVFRETSFYVISHGVCDRFDRDCGDGGRLGYSRQHVHLDTEGCG